MGTGEADEQEPVSGKSRRAEGRGQSRRAGNRDDRDVRLEAFPNERKSGVGYSRRPRVRDQGDVFSGFEDPENLRDPPVLVRVEVAEEPFLQAVSCQELECLAGVLTGDGLDLSEDAEGPKGQIFKVPDGGGDDEQTPRGLPFRRLSGHSSSSPIKRIKEIVTDRPRGKLGDRRELPLELGTPDQPKDFPDRAGIETLGDEFLL